MFDCFKACYKYYLSDDISKDGEGMDEQCRYYLGLFCSYYKIFLTDVLNISKLFSHVGGVLKEGT